MCVCVMIGIGFISLPKEGGERMFKIAGRATLHRVRKRLRMERRVCSKMRDNFLSHLKLLFIEEDGESRRRRKWRKKLRKKQEWDHHLRKGFLLLFKRNSMGEEEEEVGRKNFHITITEKTGSALYFSMKRGRGRESLRFRVCVWCRYPFSSFFNTHT